MLNFYFIFHCDNKLPGRCDVWRECWCCVLWSPVLIPWSPVSSGPGQHYKASSSLQSLKLVFNPGPTRSWYRNQLRLALFYKTFLWTWTNQDMMNRHLLLICLRMSLILLTLVCVGGVSAWYNTSSLGNCVTDKAWAPMQSLDKVRVLFNELLFETFSF